MTTDNIAAIQADAERARHRADEATRKLREREQSLHAERERRQQQLWAERFHELRTSLIPDADRERAEAQRALEDVVKADPAAAALVRLLAATMRYRALTVEAADIAPNIAEPTPPTAAMVALPDPLNRLADAIRAEAKRTVADEQRQAAELLAAQSLDDGRLPTRPVVPHEEQMAAERRRLAEDRRLRDLLRMSDEDIRSLDAEQRAEALARADEAETELQAKARNQLTRERQDAQSAGWLHT